MLAVDFIAENGGFTAGRHDAPLIGYFCALNDGYSDWNSMGHGLTYDMAIVSLYLLKSRNELPLPKSHFYLEN